MPDPCDVSTAPRQLERRMTIRDPDERLDRRARGHGKEALDLPSKTLEVRLENRGAFRDGQRPRSIAVGAPASPERDLPDRVGIASPLGPAAWRDEIELPLRGEQIHGHGIPRPRLPAADFQQVHVPGSDAEPDQQGHHVVDEKLAPARRRKRTRWPAHEAFRYPPRLLRGTG